MTIAILQTTAGHILSPWGEVPNVVLVVVVAWSLVYGPQEGMMVGFVGGVALGLVADVPMGTHAFVLTVIGFLSGLIQASPFRSRFTVPVLITVLATIVYHSVMAVILRILGWPPAIITTVMRGVAPAIVINAVLMLIVYWVVSQVTILRSRLRFG